MPYILKGACAVDAKGCDVFVGDVVTDACCRDHIVSMFETIDDDHAWIIDEAGQRLVPHLVEKVSPDR